MSRASPSDFALYYLFQPCPGCQLPHPNHLLGLNFWGLSHLVVLNTVRPFSSCVSRSIVSKHCDSCIIYMHFILAWWNFRPCGFLHTFPHKNSTLVVKYSLPSVCIIWSVSVGSSCTLPHFDTFIDVSKLSNINTFRSGDLGTTALHILCVSFI